MLWWWWWSGGSGGVGGSGGGDFGYGVGGGGGGDRLNVIVPLECILRLCENWKSRAGQPGCACVWRGGGEDGFATMFDSHEKCEYVMISVGSAG